MSGDIFGCHYLGVATGIQWVETMDSDKQSTMHKKAPHPQTKDYLVQMSVMLRLRTALVQAIFFSLLNYQIEDRGHL